MYRFISVIFDIASYDNISRYNILYLKMVVNFFCYHCNGDTQLYTIQKRIERNYENILHVVANRFLFLQRVHNYIPHVLGVAFQHQGPFLE